MTTKPVEQIARGLLIEQLRLGLPRGTSGYRIIGDRIRHPLLDEAADEIARLKAENAAKQALIEKMVEGLREFASIAVSDTRDDNELIYVRAGQLRKARSLLTNLTPPS